MDKGTDTWTTDEASELYQIERWGAGYFSIGDGGTVQVHPMRDPTASIGLMDIVEESREGGLRGPLVVRFHDIVADRVRELNGAFQNAIAEHSYAAPYMGVFPIKVNQLREVVEEIVEAGKEFNYGLEAGSKPELFAALAVHENENALIICNGYKDETFIRTALMGLKLGRNVIMVAEKLSEVADIARLAKKMDVVPRIGIRVRLHAKGAGIWATSGGESAKFGLSTSEILDAIALLEKQGISESLELLHFHIGSQIPDIQTIKRAVREAGRVYSKLRLMGQQIRYVDVGGGLAVDYDGSKTTFHSSMNYSIDEYAADIVFNIMDVCDEEKVPHPTLVSESGRAIVAHHSVLVVESFGAITKTGRNRKIHTADHKLIDRLKEILEEIDSSSLNEAWHDVEQTREEAQKRFEVGVLTLEERAAVEDLVWAIALRLEKRGSALETEDETPEFLAELRNALAAQHLCNFSLFQSLIDHWALGQLFPIMPLHRLDEEPTLPSTMVDITCDSDGKIARFINISEDFQGSLPLHEPNDEPYYIGIFLTGAYQDIMGDIHNLFGRVNEVHVFADKEEEGGYYVEEIIRGSTIAQVLAMTQYEVPNLINSMKKLVDSAVKADRVRPKEGISLLKSYEKGLLDQTYLTLE